MTADRNELIKAWIAAGLWIGIIAVESTEWLSAERTSRILYPLLHYLFSLDLASFQVWHHYIRKLGHFVGYFALSALLFRAWKTTLHVPSAPPWAMRWSAIALLMAASVASLDEWHQSFIPSRTGVFRDVVLDTWAALVAQILIAYFLTRRPKPLPAARG